MPIVYGYDLGRYLIVLEIEIVRPNKTVKKYYLKIVDRAVRPTMLNPVDKSLKQQPTLTALFNYILLNTLSNFKHSLTDKFVVYRFAISLSFSAITFSFLSQHFLATFSQE